SEMLEHLKQKVDREKGMVVRQVARLNTRERLIATWFERGSNKPIAFTNELWRMTLKEEATEEFGKALLAFIGSDVAAYLINLFSTNNHVSKEELGRIPMPDPDSMPRVQLAALANEMLSERAALDREFIVQYSAKLPEFADGEVYIPPSTFL